MHGFGRLAGCGAFVGVLVGACGPDVESPAGGTSSESTDGVECVVGAEFCACTPGGGCDPGLECSFDLCLAPDATSSSSEGPLDTGGPGSEAESTTNSADETTDTTLTSTTSTDTGIPDNCGNDELEPPEECDDGNDVSGDGCNADCTLGGQLVWEVVLDGELALDDWGERLALDSQDNVLVAAITFTSGNTDRNAWVIKLDDDGQFEWEEVFDSEVWNSSDGYWGVAAGPGDEVLVAGWASSPLDTDGVDQVVRCFSPDGDLLWEHVDPVVGDGYDYDIAVDGSGDVVVVGYHWDSDLMAHVSHLTKLTIDGDPVWSQTYPLGMYPIPTSLAIDSTGAIFTGAADGYAFLRKHTPDGVEDWTWDDGPGAWWVGGIAIDATDDVLVGGDIGDNPAHARLTRHFGDDGMVDFEDEWVGGFGAGALGLAVASDADGRAVLGGQQSGNSQGEVGVFVRKYEADGDEAWLWEHDAVDGWPDLVTGVAVGSDGFVYATGKRHAAGGNDDVFIVKLTP